LFKVLMTDECLNDCAYCINQVDLKRHRSAFQPEELAATFMEFHRLGYAAGPFLTSAISGGAPHSMEPMLKAVDILRHNYGFDGYIHLKVLPGAPFQYVEQACRLADRVSLNVEAPSPKHLARLSSGKDLEKDILAPMRWIKGLLGRPGISASGQTTQFIVGAGTETDLETFESTARLYEEMGLRRVYFSAFRPIRGTLLQDQPPAPPPTAIRSATAAHPCRPRPADTAHATNATAAANHQTTGERSTTAGRPQPVATATATATRGRSGSGSRRTQRRSRLAHEQTGSQTVSQTGSRISEKNCCASPIPQMAYADGTRGK
jgi:hypothetical protein